MTTIAYRSGVLATDKQATDNGILTKAAFKAQVVGQQVYAIAGTFSRGLKFIDWLNSDRQTDAPKLRNTLVIQMSLITGECLIWETDYPLQVEDEFYAWGSGRDVALGAMEMGASAKLAVKCAAVWDDGTGKGVQVFKSKQG